MRTLKMPDREENVGSRAGLEQKVQTEGESDPASSPTTPFAFNGSPGRRSSYVRSQSLNGRIQKPSVARSQSFHGTKACAKIASWSQHMDALQEQISYMRGSGSDQKLFGNAHDKPKDTLPSTGEVPEDRRATAMRPPSIPSSPLSSCSSPQAFPPQTPRVEDAPAATACSRALLRSKFEKWNKYKESIQGQQIPPYRSPSFHSGTSSAQRTPASSTPCSPRLQPDDAYFFDEGTAALVARQQEMMCNSSRSAAAAAAGVSTMSPSSDSRGNQRSPLTIPDAMGSWRSPLHSPESVGGAYKSPLSSHASIGSRSPGEWSACDSPSEEVVTFGRMLQQQSEDTPDEFYESVPRYVAPNFGRPSARHNSNVEAFQNMSLAGGAEGNRGGAAVPDSLGGLLAAERMEILMTKKAAAAAAASDSNDVRSTETRLASSIQQVVAKFPFNLTAKFSSPKTKLQGSWGRSLSLNTPIVPQPPLQYCTGDSSWDSCQKYQHHNNSNVLHVQCYNHTDRSFGSSTGQDLGSGDICMKQQDAIDTSLHL